MTVVGLDEAVLLFAGGRIKVAELAVDGAQAGLHVAAGGMEEVVFAVDGGIALGDAAVGKEVVGVTVVGLKQTGFLFAGGRIEIVQQSVKGFKPLERLPGARADVVSLSTRGVPADFFHNTHKALRRFAIGAGRYGSFPGFYTGYKTLGADGCHSGVGAFPCNGGGGVRWRKRRGDCLRLSLDKHNKGGHGNRRCVYRSRIDPGRQEYGQRCRQYQYHNQDQR